MADGARFTFIDLFAGVGGFHLAMSSLGGRCVMAAEIDRAARAAYEANFRPVEPGMFEDGLFLDNVRALRNPDIMRRVPRFDLLCAGFPCQPFSQAGRRQGFEDDKDRGNLFFELMHIAERRRPAVLFLENVRNLVGIHEGRTFARIEQEIRALNYEMHHRVILASDHGLPQHRPRIYIVAVAREAALAAREQGVEFAFPEPEPLAMTMSDVWGAPCERRVGYTLRVGGRNSPYGDRHNWDAYMVGGQVRRLGPVEGRRMMGFPEGHVLAANETQAMKQLGNSVAVPVVRAVGNRIAGLLDAAGRANGTPALARAA